MIKYLLIIAFILLNFSYLVAQDYDKLLDSIKTLIDERQFVTARNMTFDILNSLSLEKESIDHRYILGIGYLGMSYYYETKADSAIFYFGKAISLYKQQSNIYTKDFARYHSFLGMSYMFKSNYEKAEEYLLESINVAHKIPSKNAKLLGELHYNLAFYYKSIAKFNDSEKQYLESKRIYEENNLDKSESMATTLNGLASLYRSRANFKDAEIYYLLALEIYEINLVGDNKDLANIYNNLGVFYYQIGEYDKAKKYLEESLTINSRIYKQDNNAFAAVIHNMAHFYEKIEDYEKAKAFFVRAIEMRRRLFKDDHPDLGKSLIGLADFYMNRKQYDSSFIYYDEVISMRRRLFKDDHPDLANALNNLATAHNNMGNFKKSLPIYKEALEMRRKFLSNYDPLLAQNINNLALNYEYLDSIENAYRLYLELIDNLEKIKNNYFPTLTDKQKESFFNTFKLYYDNFYQFAIKNHNKYPDLLERLFEIEVHNKGMLLNAFTRLNQKILNENDSNLTNHYKDWISLKESIAKNFLLNEKQLKIKNINIDSLLIESQKIEKKLNLDYSEFYDEITLSKLKFQDFRNKLNDNEAILTIKRFSLDRINQKINQYIFMIIKKNSLYPILIVKENTNELENDFIKIYKDELISNDKKKSSYNNYWAFFELHLKGIKKVYFSPDGIYNKINVNILYDNKGKKYVEDEYNIIQLTSLKDIFKNQSTNQGPFVLFGNPDFNSSDMLADNKFQKIEIDSIDRSAIKLLPLPSSELEINEIVKILNKKNLPSLSYLGSNATEDNLKKVLNPRALHLSTHGYFLRDNVGSSIKKDLSIKSSMNPLIRSMLFLSKNADNNDIQNDNIEDGIFTGLEAQNLSLHNTELVVLAACETGLGEIKNGEGVFGLQRAFIQAGAQTLIMSLWKVNDKATKDLMIGFYKEWLSGKSKSESFKLAKKKVRDQYKYPFFWGAFIMIGE